MSLPPAGHSVYARPAPVPAPRKTSSTGPAFMLIAGITALLFAALAAAWALSGVTGTRGLLGSGVHGERLLLEDDRVVWRFEGLKAGERYVLCSVSDFAPSEVRITDGSEDGAVITGSTPARGVSIPLDAGSYEPRVFFDAPEGGTIVAVFDAEARPLSVDVNRYAAYADFGRNAAAIGIGIIAAGLFGTIGLGLTIGGGVWLGSRRRNARQVRNSGTGETRPSVAGARW